MKVKITVVHSGAKRRPFRACAVMGSRFIYYGYGHAGGSRRSAVADLRAFCEATIAAIDSEQEERLNPPKPKLKPCPVCGKKPAAARASSHGRHHFSASISCSNEWHEVTVYGRTLAEVRKQWNIGKGG